MRPYMATKRRCVWNKTFLLGPIVWNKVISCFISPLFIMFLHEMATKALNVIPKRDITKSPKQEYQCLHKMDL